MDKIQRKLWEEQQRSFISLDRPLFTEQITVDNNIIQACSQLTKPRLIEENDNDIYILWLTNEDTKECESLYGINIKLFHSNDIFIDFISELQTFNVFVIIDHELASNILSFLDDFSQIVFIYVLSNEENNNISIMTNSERSFRRISNTQELFQLIIKDIETCEDDSICSTILDLTTTEESTNQTRNVSSIWYYLLIEALFDLNVYNTNAKADLIEYCRQQYLTNNSVQNTINEFENEYSTENAIRWYTRDSFIYRQLNKVLRIRDIDAIFKFRFFIIDLQKQLEQYYNENNITSIHTVYRGQQISLLELNKFKKSVGKYISFNTFLSTTSTKDVALMYAGSGDASLLF